MDHKEQWANEILHSLDGIQKAEPSTDLFAQIINKIEKDKVVNIIPLSRLRWLAIASCLLIGLNIYTYQYVTNNTAIEAENNSLISNYHLYK